MKQSSQRVNNRKWNPIYSAKAKIIRKELNTKLIQVDPIRSSRLLNDDNIDREFNYLLRERTYEQFCGMTLEEAMASGQYAVYVGITKRTLAEEALRWLTERGTNSSASTPKRKWSRPVLQWPSGQKITMKEAIDRLEANYFMIHHSQLRLNEKRLEDSIHGAIQHYALGHRLHRWVAMGRSDEGGTVEYDPNYVCKLFIAYFRIESANYANKSMVINGHHVCTRP